MLYNSCCHACVHLQHVWGKVSMACLSYIDNTSETLGVHTTLQDVAIQRCCSDLY